ncbi:TPA: glycosyltransferase [Streptococcus suis]
MEKFSLLMSVYDGETPEFLEEAFQSLLQSTILPDQIVMVLDGPISHNLQAILEKYEKEFTHFTKVSLETNQGLGVALAVGVEACQYDLIARFDCDDILLPNRFQLQLDYFERHAELDLLGGQILEFSATNEFGQRRVPVDQDTIVTFAKKRNPFNHMTVMFRKTAIMAAGNYIPLKGYEDYYLWLRLLKAGARVANLPDVLVRARVGSGFSTRRGGSKYLLQTIQAISRFEKEGLLSKSSALYRVLSHSLIILLPTGCREFLYRTILRRNEATNNH